MSYLNRQKKKIEPIAVQSVEKVREGLYKEEWQVHQSAVPKWWNEEFHALVIETGPAQNEARKYCKGCDLFISEKGCSHNINILDQTK